jgi:hypothetical protein
MPIIRIIAPQQVSYSQDNGLSKSIFDPGEIYQVKDHVAAGLMCRNQAELLTGADIDRAIKEKDEKESGVTDLPPLPKKPPPPPPPERRAKEK